MSDPVFERIQHDTLAAGAGLVLACIGMLAGAAFGPFVGWPIFLFGVGLLC